MEFQDAITQVKQGRGMALLGAGFSVGARAASSNEELPLGGKLAANIMHALGETEQVDYGLAAELYGKVHSANPTALATFLKEQFAVGSVADEHRKFAKLLGNRSIPLTSTT